MCSACSRRFHGSCMNLTSGDINFLNANNTAWQCKECLDGLRQRRSLSDSDVSARDATATHRSQTGARTVSAESEHIAAAAGSADATTTDHYVSAEDKHLTIQHFNVIMQELQRARSVQETLSSKLSSLVESQGRLSHAIEKCNEAIVGHTQTLQQHNMLIDQNSQRLGQFQDRMLKMEQRVDSLVDDEQSQPGVSGSSGVNFPGSQTNEVVLELREREVRSSNLMVYNVPESKSRDVKQRISDDLQIVGQIIEILGVTVDIRKTIRVGRRGNEDRPLKLLLSSREDVLKCLKSRGKLADSQYRLDSDLTQLQRSHLRGVREELTRRIEGGERELTIRYMGGVPKIVKKSVRGPKN